MWLDVDMDNVDVDWHSEEISSSDDSSDTSDNEEQLAESALDDHDELDGELDDELNDDEYLEEVKCKIYVCMYVHAICMYVYVHM